MIQYARNGSDDNKIVNVPAETHLTISGLFACAEYPVMMATVNANGTGPFSNPVVATSGENSEFNYQAKTYVHTTGKCFQKTDMSKSIYITP